MRNVDWLATAVAVETEDHIMWPFGKHPRGYGVVWHQGRGHLAHRVALMLGGAAIPADLEVRHLCGVTGCVNPKHLTIGTKSENELDKRRHGTSLQGERHFNAKLTEEQVLEIRQSPHGYKRLGRQYGVSRTAIRAIRKRVTWQHLP